jgi:hypothetical protein
MDSGSGPPKKNIPSVGSAQSHSADILPEPVATWVGPKKNHQGLDS